MAADREDRRERVLAVLYELPGPHGFKGDPVGRVSFGDALDELPDLDAPTTNDAARLAYQQRVADRARKRGGS